MVMYSKQQDMITSSVILPNYTYTLLKNIPDKVIKKHE